MDKNSNGLSDVWEQLYDASALQLLGDEDNDGFSNLDECVAGTDPRDPDSRPGLFPKVITQTDDKIELSFQ